MADNALIKAKDIINTHDVVVFSKTTCPYCKMTKQRLRDQEKLNPYVIELNEIDDGPDIQAALKKAYNQGTVPNIFIKGNHIGGNSDLTATTSEKIQQLLSAEDDKERL
ncbi:putative glutaredoxin [Xylariaceae sp. FL0016]|nr:putative glutaredoxin [Xylariaceae sp. FL0016]